MPQSALGRVGDPSALRRAEIRRREALGLKRVLAVTSQDNENSIRVLEQIGFQDENRIRLSEDAPEVERFAADG